MGEPLAVDLYCGLGGWSEGLMAEGYKVIGFDIECHVYGVARYPSQLVLQDVRTIHGRQFKDAALIVASPPCQAYSYMAMPWSKAKQQIREYESGVRDVADLTALFDACFRIQREAMEAAGHFIPLVVENVRGAQKWVGKARWHYESFYLWGDVPALMPMTRARAKVPTMGAGWYPPDHPKHVPGLAFNTHAERGTKTSGLLRQRDGHAHTRHLTNQAEHDAVKNGGDWFSAGGDCSLQRRAGSKSSARKAASAHIAKIPLPLSRWIARAWHPAYMEVA